MCKNYVELADYTQLCDSVAGRHLTEEDMDRGLSKEQVLESS